MSGRVSSRRLRYRDALRTGAVLLCRISDTKKTRATCQSHTTVWATKPNAGKGCAQSK